MAASYVPVVKNGASGAIFYVALRSQANTKLFQVNPTIAAGDFKISIDGAALGNLGTLPAVTPAGSVWVKITLSQAEVNGDNIQVQCIDAAGAEWCDLALDIQTAARQINDLTFPNTSGRGMDVDASGGVELGSCQAGSITNAAFAAGAIDAAAIAANAITSSELAADCITSSQLAASAASEIATAVGALALADPSAVPAVTATILQALGWMLALSRNKVTQTATQQKVFQDDGSTLVATSAVSDDGTTFTRDEFA